MFAPRNSSLAWDQVPDFVRVFPGEPKGWTQPGWECRSDKVSNAPLSELNENRLGCSSHSLSDSLDLTPSAPPKWARFAFLRPPNPVGSERARKQDTADGKRHTVPCKCRRCCHGQVTNGDGHAGATALCRSVLEGERFSRSREVQRASLHSGQSVLGPHVGDRVRARHKLHRPPSPTITDLLLLRHCGRFHATARQRSFQHRPRRHPFSIKFERRQRQDRIVILAVYHGAQQWRRLLLGGAAVYRCDKRPILRAGFSR